METKLLQSISFPPDAFYKLNRRTPSQTIQRPHATLIPSHPAAVTILETKLLLSISFPPDAFYKINRRTPSQSIQHFFLQPAQTEDNRDVQQSKYFKRIAVILLVVSVFLQSWLMLPKDPAHRSSPWLTPSQSNSSRSHDNMTLLVQARPGRARHLRQSNCLASQVSTFLKGCLRHLVAKTGVDRPSPLPPLLDVSPFLLSLPLAL
jgi:hypothetical protein